MFANQCCELHVRGNGKSAWGIYKKHDGTGYLRRVNTKVGERFGPCNPEQACARELILDDQTLIVVLVGIAGTGKTLIALLCGVRAAIARQGLEDRGVPLNAEAGRQLGLPAGRPRRQDGAVGQAHHRQSRLHHAAAERRHALDQPAVRPPGRQGAHAARRPVRPWTSCSSNHVLEISPINYLRGRSIHDAAIIVDDGQNLTQEDMKLVLTRAGEGSRVILTGDPDQIDRAEIDSLSNGLVQVVERFKGESCFAHLTMKDVVRSRIAELAAKLL